jgi:hypothetical protein
MWKNVKPNASPNVVIFLFVKFDDFFPNKIWNLQPISLKKIPFVQNFIVQKKAPKIMKQNSK